MVSEVKEISPNQHKRKVTRITHRFLKFSDLWKTMLNLKITSMEGSNENPTATQIVDILTDMTGSKFLSGSFTQIYN